MDHNISCKCCSSAIGGSIPVVNYLFYIIFIDYIPISTTNGCTDYVYNKLGTTDDASD